MSMILYDFLRYCTILFNVRPTEIVNDILCTPLKLISKQWIIFLLFQLWPKLLTACCCEIILSPILFRLQVQMKAHGPLLECVFHGKIWQLLGSYSLMSIYLKSFKSRFNKKSMCVRGAYLLCLWMHWISNWNTIHDLYEFGNIEHDTVTPIITCKNAVFGESLAFWELFRNTHAIIALLLQQNLSKLELHMYARACIQKLKRQCSFLPIQNCNS